jgi:hypothetical protein
MIDLKQKYDSSTVAIMRQALNEIMADDRFLIRRSFTPLEVAEHILHQAASGERDLNRLKSSVFEKLRNAAASETNDLTNRISAFNLFQYR